MRRRWHEHGWDTALSLRLIFSIVPRLPRWLLPLVAVPATALCLGHMRQERRAAARNLRRILGRGGWPLWATVWGLFYGFSRFLVGYCDLARLSPTQLHARTEAEASFGERLRDALSEGRGVIVLTAHLGNWEVGTRLLERIGRPVHVVMQADRRNVVDRWLTRRRARGPVRTIQMGGDSAGTLAVRAALARNEVVAMQGDRAHSGRVIELPLFGERFAFPLGPFLLAYGWQTPLVPTFVLQRGWSRWRVEMGEPITFPRTADRDADLRAGAGAYAAALERVVRAHPDQWFNFFELWAGRPVGGGPRVPKVS